jgi:hypothetical protein
MSKIEHPTSVKELMEQWQEEEADNPTQNFTYWLARKYQSLEKERDEIHEDCQRMAEELIDATPDPQDGEWREIVLLRQQLQKLMEGKEEAENNEGATLIACKNYIRFFELCHDKVLLEIDDPEELTEILQLIELLKQSK